MLALFPGVYVCIERDREVRHHSKCQCAILQASQSQQKKHIIFLNFSKSKEAK